MRQFLSQKGSQMQRLFTVLSLCFILSSCQSLFQEKLKIGVNANAKPYVYLDYKTGFQGSDIELAKRFAESLDMKAEFIPLDAEETIESLKDGKIDFALSGLVKYPKTDSELTFSSSYQSQEALAFVRRNDAIALKRAKVGSFLDQQGISWGIIESARNKGFAESQVQTELKTYKTLGTALKALRSREIIILICDPTIVSNYTNDKPFSDITSLQWTTHKEELVWLTQKDSQYLLRINNFLKK